MIARHTGTDYWVVCVGFTPGCYFSLPLDPTKWLKAPKYRTPRSYTPARLVALAGFSTGAYPVASPGGYQVIGRLAVNIYEPTAELPPFPEDGVLLQAGDRLRYYNVNALEYDDIWSEAEEGTYKYHVTDELFDVAGYVREFGRAAEHAEVPALARGRRSPDAGRRVRAPGRCRGNRRRGTSARPSRRRRRAR